MGKHPITAAALGLVLAAQPLTEAVGSVYAAPRLAHGPVRHSELVQYGAPDNRNWQGQRPRGNPGPRAHPGWRGEPGWRGAPAWRGPQGWSGRPYWSGRPWVRRPYYGTI